jgi:hypothetical protein
MSEVALLLENIDRPQQTEDYVRDLQPVEIGQYSVEVVQPLT